MVIAYNGNVENGKQYLLEGLKFDPENKLCSNGVKSLRKMENMKNEAGDLFKEGKIVNAIEAFTNCLDLDPSNNGYN